MANSNTAVKKPEAANPIFQLDAAFISPFVECTQKVLRVTCLMQIQKEKVFLRRDEDRSLDITGIMPIRSSKFHGSFAISFEKSTFLFAVGQMLGEKFEIINDDNKDAAGEICNQIFGNAKRQLNIQGHTIEPALPVTILGQHRISHLAQGPCIVVPFTTQIGKIFIEVMIGPPKGNH